MARKRQAEWNVVRLHFQERAADPSMGIVQPVGSGMAVTIRAPPASHPPLLHPLQVAPSVAISCGRRTLGGTYFTADKYLVTLCPARGHFGPDVLRLERP
jgi:hypothetical protein